ncbi:hypothetical protein NDU88_004915 [Pleurodeles waltl]|uniref:Uncharacterized protein n=1 Tax=Pleurodeles waltl TaxID=8319 RepID=A0AAV7VKG6_PLEWA|nr:hypothetical protein NDU88_004915 [Pleurodeles waltl]
MKISHGPQTPSWGFYPKTKSRCRHAPREYCQRAPDAITGPPQTRRGREVPLRSPEWQGGPWNPSQGPLATHRSGQTPKIRPATEATSAGNRQEQLVVGSPRRSPNTSYLTGSRMGPDTLHR